MHFLSDVLRYISFLIEVLTACLRFTKNNWEVVGCNNQLFLNFVLSTLCCSALAAPASDLSVWAFLLQVKAGEYNVAGEFEDNIHDINNK